MTKKKVASKADLNISNSSEMHIKKDLGPTAEPTGDLNNEIFISKQAANALVGLLFYSFLMFTLPFGSFFGTRYLLQHYTDVSDFGVTALSVSSAVITVYIIIALYAYKAYNEKDVPSEPDVSQRNQNKQKSN